MMNYSRNPIKHVWLAITVVVFLFAAGRQGAFGQTNTFPSSGNVGIGTASPAVPLHVSSASLGQRITFTDTSSFGGLVIYEGSTQKANFTFTGSASGSSYIGGANTLQIWNAASGPIILGTNATERLRIDGSGNVGIGTTTVPSWTSNYKVLSMNSIGFGIAAGNSSANNGNFLSENAYYDGAWKYTTTNPASVFTFAGGTQNIRVAGSGTAGSNITWISALSVDNSGSVGINKASPNASYKLDVNGDTNVTGNLNATGTITGGNIQAKYQDVAEWVPSSEQITSGTVVVLDTTKSNQVISSSEAYDTRVAGVVSEQPGIALGESGAGKVLVATTGRVLVKVDASQGPIHIGDLLVTSDVPGVAMKSEPVKVGKRMMHLPGTLIGKALEPLEKGSGKILVLLSLQ